MLTSQSYVQTPSDHQLWCVGLASLSTLPSMSGHHQIISCGVWALMLPTNQWCLTRSGNALNISPESFKQIRIPFV